MAGDGRVRPTLTTLVAPILFGVGVFVVASGCSDGEPAPSAGPESGMTLFAANCSGCHGLEGQGGVNAPQLAGGAVVVAFPVVTDQIAVVANGRAHMPAFGGRLTADEIELVVDFTRDELVDVGAGTGSAVVEERTAADLYGQLCSFCHGIDGEGRAGPRLGGGATLGTYPSFDDEIAVVVGGIGTMPSFASQLTDDQIRAIVGYTRGELSG